MAAFLIGCGRRGQGEAAPGVVAPANAPSTAAKAPTMNPNHGGMYGTVAKLQAAAQAQQKH
jgi:hypothetical protein